MVAWFTVVVEANCIRQPVSLLFPHSGIRKRGENNYFSRFLASDTNISYVTMVTTMWLKQPIFLQCDMWSTEIAEYTIYPCRPSRSGFIYQGVLGQSCYSCDGSCRTCAFTCCILSSTNSILLLLIWEQICEIYAQQKQSLLWSPGSIYLYSDMGWYKAQAPSHGL